MPSTPRVQEPPIAGSNSHSRLSNVGASPSYTSKDQLLRQRAPSLLEKTVSPFNESGIRYDATIGSDLHSEAKARAGREGNGQLPSSTFRTQMNPRNGVKEEAVEEAKNLTAAVHSLGQTFTTYFKSSRTRAWEKSRKIEQDDCLMAKNELNEQLRPEEEGLVPLNAIAGRVVLYGWQLFANQVEINASLSPLKRRKRIYDDAHEARKQLIKLLVLVQWSKVAPELKVARSLIAFINDHFVQTDAAVTSLAETRGILTTARLRKYDLVSAIEALGTGAPQRIPPLLKDVIQSRKPYTDLETIELVTELDKAIRLRLTCEEILPMPMLSYSIGDGRACFRVPMLFEADLTLSGSSPEDRWWLLRIKFDFKVTGEGADRFPRQPRKNQRLNLLALADSELAPRSVAAVLEEGGVGEVEGGEKVSRDQETAEDIEMRDAEVSLAVDDNVTARRKDAPLVRLYNLLQSQALQYWLDILHFQAVQQVKLNWGRRLSVRMEAVRTSRLLHITYWQRIDSDPSNDSAGWKPTASGSLTISVEPRTQESGFEKALKRLSTTSDSEITEHSRGQLAERLEMHVEWNVQGPASGYLESKNVSIDPQDLDARRLLLEVTSRHSKASMKVIKVRIESSSLARLIGIHEYSRLTVNGIEEHTLDLTLSEKVVVALKVDQISGLIRLEEANDGAKSSISLASHDWLKDLRETSTKINEKPDQIVFILQSLRSKVILKDLEEKSTLLGITVTTRMPLRQVDYAKLRARPGTLMYIALLQCAGYYMVIHIGDESIRVALMCAGTFLEDLMTSMRIVSLEWLDWQRVVSSTSFNATSPKKRKREEGKPAPSFSQEDLSKLYSYSVALVCYHKIEQQLRARDLSFVHVGGSTKLRPPPALDSDPSGPEDSTVGAIVPSLCVDTTKLLSFSSREMIYRNVSIRLLHWWDPSKAHVVFSVKMKLKQGKIVTESILETDQEKIQFDGSTNILKFSCRDIENCLAIFVNSWRHIERILDLNRELLSDRQKDFFNLIECDLIKIRFKYAEELLAEVRWVRDLTIQRGGYYTLSLDSIATEGKKNPHWIIQKMLTQQLNHQDDSSPSFWLNFLDTLRQMLPILEHVSDFPERCLDSVECPELQIQHPCRFRLLFLDKFLLDVRLVKDKKILFSDGANLFHQNTIKMEGVKDDFTLEELSSSSTTTTTTTTFPKITNAIPSLQTILADLLSQFQQQQNNKESSLDQQKNSVLIFSNGLLCPNLPSIIDFFLPRLIKRIQEVVE